MRGHILAMVTYPHIHTAVTFTSFKNQLKTHLFRKHLTTHTLEPMHLCVHTHTNISPLHFSSYLACF